MNASSKLEKSADKAVDFVASLNWPHCASQFPIYDKYSRNSSTVNLKDESWTFWVQGQQRTISFAEGLAGRHQRVIVISTQSGSSPSTIYKFVRSLVANWSLYCRMLERGPEGLIRTWAQEVHNVDVAKAGKTTLRLAAQSRVGSWSPRHVGVIKALSTEASKSLHAQRRKVARREYVLDSGSLLAVTNVMDRLSHVESLSETETEGIAALGLAYQFGVRPVQILALGVEHIETLFDVDGETVCLVSFHEAKKGEGLSLELVSQIKPEWCKAVVRLKQFAISSGRNRLFAMTSSTRLWRSVKLACQITGFNVKFTQKQLRHSGAQLLADSGHDRKSIQRWLGHSSDKTAKVYINSSATQAEMLNKALGVSKLYTGIISLASGKFISADELVAASEDRQIGGVVGNRIIGGIGICDSGQSSCAYDPVVSCHGCHKFLPSMDRDSHVEVAAGLRDQVLEFSNNPITSKGPAFMQLTRALAAIQQTVAALDAIGNSSDP